MQTDNTATDSTMAVIGRWTVATVALMLAWWLILEPLTHFFPNDGSALVASLVAGFAISIWWPGWVKAGFRATVIQIVLGLIIFGGFGVGVIWLITLSGH